MSDEIEIGLEHEREVAVTEEMSPAHLPAPVLSTPAMIQEIELTCLEAVQPLLAAGQTTVGTHVDVSHSGPAFAGETIRIHVALLEQEKRRLTFETRVASPRGAISVGRHQRAIVDLSRFSS
jgi:fluoroacetyl-CoA thioesterase